MDFSFFHNGIFIAIIAHGLIGISLVWDKVLLRRPETTNLLSFVFWLGFISVFGLLLIPFGFHWPSLGTAVLAFAAGVLHLAANYFYYAALKAGEASQTLAIMGGFSPVATALIAVALLKHPLGQGSALGFFLLVLGGFVMFFSEKLNIRRILPMVLLASGSFGLLNVMQKLAFDRTNFVSGYVFFTFGTFIGSVLMLVPASWRKQILESSEKAEPKSRFWYFVNRFISGVGSFLTFYAISLTAPAIVDAITGLRYVIIFLGAYGITRLRPDWLREDFTGFALLGKTLATLLIAAGLVLLGLKNEGQGGVSSTRLVLRPRPLQAGARTGVLGGHGFNSCRGFVSGHDFSRAGEYCTMSWALAPVGQNLRKSAICPVLKGAVHHKRLRHR
jgi:drug/metabolite transporter (DMT)-like permease